MDGRVMVDDFTARTFETYYISKEKDMYIVVCIETMESTLFMGDESYEL